MYEPSVLLMLKIDVAFDKWHEFFYDVDLKNVYWNHGFYQMSWCII